MKYYELFDDVTIRRRWHLGEVFDSDENSPQELWTGKPTRHSALKAEITHGQRTLQFSLTSFAVPVATNALGTAIESIAGADLQRIPIRINKFPGFEILNSVRSIQCLEESKSEFTKWTDHDHRPDLIGQYRQVTKLILDPSRIPEDAHFFRVEGWLIALIASERVKEIMEKTGCFGAKFQQVCF